MVFGFDGKEIKALVIPRMPVTGGSGQKDYKLPGDFISDTEDLDSAAYRVLEELTGLKDVYLRQYAVFGNPERVNKKEDLEWLRKTTGLQIQRVVTIAYYSLVKLDESRIKSVKQPDAEWLPVKSIRNLAFDHLNILQAAIRTLQRKMQSEPVGVQLLPQKFTLRQLQNLYEAIMGTPMDNRNFRKKVLRADYLIPLQEKQSNVSHKPARLYRFDRKVFDEKFNPNPGFQF